MSRYERFCSARRSEQSARELRNGYQRMLDVANSQYPLYHYDDSINKLHSILMNMESDHYHWKDEAADQLKESLESIEDKLQVDRNTYIRVFQEGVDSAESARKAFARNMDSLYRSFNDLDWIECALGEMKDGTEAGIRNVKRRIADLIRSIS